MKKILGYTNVWGIAPGETLNVMVSTYGPPRYRADLVRVICGDDDPDPGIQIGSTIPLTTEVGNGLFQVDLDFGSTAFNGDARWLEIDVCCSSPCAPGFTTLTPRQELTPTPYALFALNGGSGGDGHSLDAADGEPIDALFVDNDGNVGIGTDTPSSTLEVAGNVEVTNLLDNDATSFFDGGCGDNAHVTSISATGAISCAGDSGDISGVLAGIGLTGGGTAGALTISHMDTSAQDSMFFAGGRVIQEITLDSFGHLTGLSSIGLDTRYVQEDGDTMFGPLILPSDGLTVGTDQLVVSSGNVGIGTTSPSARLDVVGTTELNGDVTINSSLAVNTDKLFVNGTTGNVGIGTANPTYPLQISASSPVLNLHDSNSAGPQQTGYVRFSNTIGTERGWVGFGSSANLHFSLMNIESAGNTLLGAGGNVGLALTPEGNVGIGTTAPETSLDTERVRIRDGGPAPTTGAGLEMLYDGTRAHIFAFDRDGGTFPDLVLQPQPDGGNVGIGTTNPLARLHIHGDGNDKLLLRGQNGAPFLHFRKNVNGSDWILRHDDGRLHFQTEPPPAAGTEALTIASTKRLGIGNTAPAFPLEVGTPGTNGNGAHVTNGGVWTNGSDRNSKKNFTPVDQKDILAKVADLPITAWQYKREPDSVRHIGPVAQDFYAAFGLGGSDKHIGTVDIDGVALAAIQGLHKLVQEKDGRIDALHEEIASMSERLERLESLFTQPEIQRTGGTP